MVKMYLYIDNEVIAIQQFKNYRLNRQTDLSELFANPHTRIVTNWINLQWRIQDFRDWETPTAQVGMPTYRLVKFFPKTT